MKYLAILSELFHSDKVKLLILGSVVTFIIGFSLKYRRKKIIGAFVSLIIYIGCEIAIHIQSSYTIEFITLFLGTIALGGALGFVISMLCIPKRKDKGI